MKDTQYIQIKKKKNKNKKKRKINHVKQKMQREEDLTTLKEIYPQLDEKLTENIFENLNYNFKESYDKLKEILVQKSNEDMGKILDDGQDLKNQISLVNERGISENCYNRENKKIDENLLSEINIHIESYLKDINKNLEDINLQEIKIQKDKKINNEIKKNTHKKKPPDNGIQNINQIKNDNSIFIIKKKKKKIKKM